MQTRTFNRLHFSDLAPLRFEDLCLHILTKYKKWKELNHFGRSGSDNGVDIHAVEEIDNIERHWYVQCKRYIKITKRDLQEFLGSISKNQTTPYKLLVIVSCDVSRSLHDFFKNECRNRGVPECEIWTSTILEGMLYSEYKDLLFIYFGIQLNVRQMDNASKVRYSLKMQKRLKKDFFDHELQNKRDAYETVSYEPYFQFTSQTVCIRSVDDVTYPRVDDIEPNQINPWFKAVLYDFYHRGIEIWIGSAMGLKALFDENGNWELLDDYYDERQNDPQYTVKKVSMIGRIPFTSIIDYSLEGDEYSSEPHIFCKFEHEGKPYEKIYYRIRGFAKDKTFPFELDDNKKVSFK